MKTIIVFYKKAKYPFYLMIISLILAILNCGNKAFFLIFMFYSLLSMLLVFLKNKYENSKFLNIFIVISSFPFLILIFLALMFIGVIISLTPDKKLSKYKYSDYINYFPKEIPKEYEAASYYRTYGFLQGGDFIVLYLQLDSNSISDYKSKFEKINVERPENTETNFTYFNSPYEKGVTSDFKMYTIEAKCYKSGYCNHGLDKHVVINENTNEIIFFYGNW
ncbi:MAG: hypothetical protein OSJ70_00210 [Bacilli bacterium]|nr:hypothetical protein [Bacilli bacterium]